MDTPTSTPAATVPPPPPPAPGGPARALWHLLQPVLVMLVLLAVVVAAATGGAVWLLRSQEGTVWLLSRVPGLQVQGLQGALLSERFDVERVEVRWGTQSVTIDALQARGLVWHWHPSRGAWVGLDAEHLQARRVDVQTGPPGPKPVVLPRTLDMPLRLHAARAQVAELQIESLTPMHNVDAREVRLWEPGGREYQAQSVSMEWDRAQVEGSVSLGAHPPFTLQAQARFRSRGDGPAWTADARIQGPLARFELTGTLRGTAARTNAAAPTLDLEAAITPLNAWPIGRLRLRTQALDLSTLSAKAPQTLLSGRADIDSSSRDGPLGAAIELDNANPGRWNEGRVPVRRLQARVRSPDADRKRLLIEDFDLLLGRGTDPAGRWRGNGQWAGNRLQIDSRIDELRPQLLDTRAAQMNISGPLAFTLTGLPAPDTATTASGPHPLTLELRSTLEGRIEGSPLPVKLSIDGLADGQRIELRELRAEAGSAQAVLAFFARRAAGGAWQLRSSGRLSDFDPVPWWPGDEGSAWRSGTHRLSGSWALDLTLPPVTPDLSALALSQGTVGTGTVNIDRSLLAGVPLALRLDLGQRGSAEPAPSTISGDLLLGGNRLLVSGRGNPLGDGQADHLHFELQADNLGTLAPLARLQPDLAAWIPRAGKAQASLDVEGRWPDVRSAGKAQLQGLQIGAIQARSVQADWRLDTASDQPLLLQADLQGLVYGSQKVEQLQVDLRGTGRQHRLDLTAALPQGPPAVLEATFGLRTAAGTLAQLRADGAWTADGNGGGRWAGQVARLSLGPWGGPGVAAPTGAGTAWVDARDLRAEVRFDAKDGLAEVQASAGQMRLAEAATLRWDEVRVDLRGTHPAYALRADIEPFELAPLLARAQPAMRWSGDLRLAAKVDLKVGDKVDADIVFERRDGDLRLAEDQNTVAFGLTDLRAVASAHDGHWQLAGAFAGKTLGEASARLNLRPRPDQRWPTADTPIDGLIEAHVANLGVWSSWVPPGWRLSGELRTSASVSGRLGEPDYAGEVSATDVAVRNLLLGVDVRQGDALVRLKGATAEIERFTLRGGDGTIQVRGQARLAGKGNTLLQLQADRFRALGRVDRQLIVSGALDVGMTGDQFRMEGKLHVDEGLFDLSRSDAPTLDDDVTVRQAQPARVEAAAPPPPQRPRRNQVVAVEIDLGDKLRVRGRGLDTTLGGKLKLGSVNNRLTLNGIVSAAGGSYAAYGQKLDIDRGLMIFSGDVENPALDVLALRPNLDMQVGVAITGQLLAPRVRLYSSTDMSDSDKLSWLVLGRAADGLGRADTALLQRAAVALLAGEGEAPTDALLRNLGLDSLSVRQSDTDVRETVISLGKQLSRRWYVGYERGVNATTGTFQLIYRIAQRFTLRAQSGAENSLDLIWVWRIEGEPPVQAGVPKSPAATPP